MLLALLNLILILATLAYGTGPDVLVVNSIPERTPVSEETLREVRVSTEAPRPAAGTPGARKVIEAHAEVPLPPWPRSAKVTAPRLLLARLWCGMGIEEANAYLREARPWSVPGSTWSLNKGDYDFTEVTLTTVLWMFGDRPDRLYPETLDHLLSVLLLEEGGKPTLTVPRTGGLIYDTENHILMTESSRYLKNQWLRVHGSADPAHDNAANGLLDWFTGYLNHISLHGFREFNSVPYQTYAMQPLLNIEAFAEPPELGALARRILDDEAWRFALGSLDNRQCVPFRRQPRYMGSSRLDLSHLSDTMPVWAAPEDQTAEDSWGKARVDVIAALLPYRPPSATLDWAYVKPREYFVQMGHGKNGSPELHSGGPGWLLSAGGVYRGVAEQVVARPSVLLLSDGARMIEDCIHIAGAGPATTWNNTGVHVRFACGNAPVHIPAHFRATAADGGWNVFSFPGPLAVATFSGADFGLVAVFPETDAVNDIHAALQNANPDTGQLRRIFHWPEGGPYRNVEYDVNASAGTWIIKRVDAVSVDRDYDRWPLMTPDLSP